jgi:hypothetical protein
MLVERLAGVLIWSSRFIRSVRVHRTARVPAGFRGKNIAEVAILENDIE